MGDISRVVQVAVTKGTRQVSQAGFGVGLILSNHSAFAGRARVYGSLSAVGDDFATTDDEYLAAQLYFSQARTPQQLVIGRIDAGDADIAESIDAVIEENDDWYALILIDRTQSVVEAAAAKVESLKKIFITASADTDILDPVATSDVAYVLQQLSYTRTAVLYHSTAATAWPEAGWLGRMLPLEPGEGTWKFKTIAGVAADALTEAQITAASDKNANVYISIGGVSITSEGVMVGGEYIDVTRFIDFFTSRLQENVYSVLVNSEKVPYTTKGIIAIKNAVGQTVQLGLGVGGIAPDPVPVISTPELVNIPTADKAARVLKNVEFAFTLAGAIHKVEVQGFVSV